MQKVFYAWAFCIIVIKKNNFIIRLVGMNAGKNECLVTQLLFVYNFLINVGFN